VCVCVLPLHMCGMSCVYVSMWGCVCMGVRVCKCVCLCVCEFVCVGEKDRRREGERFCECGHRPIIVAMYAVCVGVHVCMCEIECVCVCGRERERERERQM